VNATAVVEVVQVRQPVNPVGSDGRGCLDKPGEKLSLAALRRFYDDTELAILFDWLAWSWPAPLRGRATLFEDAKQADSAGGPVRLLRSADGYNGRNAGANAVARLVFSVFQSRLPQWAAISADGSALCGRQPMPRRDAEVALLPRFLFMLNWADSGPGFSWPESCHVAYLPAFKRYVVTASRGSPETHGYTDEAIRHFAADEHVDDGIHRVIVDWWARQASAGGGHRWAYLFQTGEVDAAATFAGQGPPGEGAGQPGWQTSG
jgi:hypothetical protein